MPTNNHKMMNSPKVFLVLAMIMALAVTHTATPSARGSFLHGEDEDSMEAPDPPLSETQGPTSLRGPGRFLALNFRFVLACDKRPWVCSGKDSRGPDCCMKRCVNVMTDTLNCGKCGKKCKFSETCCSGKCVNTMSNKQNCGRCNKKCKKGSTCAYGMCNYA